MPRALTRTVASRFARLALAGVRRDWPHAYQHMALRAADVRHPRKLHPAFFGCLDWHSAVHGHWTLARILRLFPDLPRAARIRAALDENLTPGHLAVELAYFKAAGRGSFERPYGWGWLLALAAELRAGRDPCARRWSLAVRPLEEFIAEAFCGYLRRLPYPVRTGGHSNTAFALSLALDYARVAGDRRLEKAVVFRSRAFYGADSDAPAAWEPGGEDFLSPTLAEADLMSRVLRPAHFRRWLARFLPAIEKGGPPEIMRPPRVLDRRDAKQVHLDGLCLSRAWALGRIACALPSNARILAAAERHAGAGLARVSSGDYAGEHWLASFALYLLTESREASGVLP